LQVFRIFPPSARKGNPLHLNSKVISQEGMEETEGEGIAEGASRITRFSPISDVETADDTDNADDADKQELGGETGRISPKHSP